MSDWSDPAIATEMRANADRDLQAKSWPPHFVALANAVRSTQCPGSILLIGCGVGHEREILDRAGVEYRSFSGLDINDASIKLAKERYPESTWYYLHETSGSKYDTVIDGALVLHMEDWRAHLSGICEKSRRFVILHRVPLTTEKYVRDTGIAETHGRPTAGYGKLFPAWRFAAEDVVVEMASHGFMPTGRYVADGESETLVFAKPRHYVTYTDRNYLPRLKVLHASMMKHCQPFRLHVLAYDAEVGEWADSAPNVVTGSYADLIVRNPKWYEPGIPGPPRTRVEHLWTIGSCHVADVLERIGEPVTYLDADLAFFASPEPVFAEIGGAPAGVVPHSFAPASAGLPGPTKETHEIFGLYNCGLVYIADKRIAWDWAEACRLWCSDRVEEVEAVGGPVPIPNRRLRYGDQGYLTEWPEKYGAHVVQYPGAEPGPWCAHTRALDVRDGVVHFGGVPLVLWHYSSLALHEDGTYTASRPEYRITKRQEDILYADYVSSLRDAT